MSVRRRWSGRHGFTLIELLVVIAIIAILIGLLVPAVQKVRDAAARGQCQNNLKQVALALHGYHDVHKRFPAIALCAPGGCNTNNLRDMNWGPTWVTLILPHIEQGPLFKAYNPKVAAKTTANAPVIATVIPILLCPKDKEPRPFSNSGQNAPFPMARSNYGINIGLGRARQNGAFNTAARRGFGHIRQQWSARMGDVQDGTSNTLMVGELLMHDALNDNTWGVWALAGGATVSGSNDNPTSSTLLINSDARLANQKNWTPNCGNGLTNVDPMFSCEDSDAAHSVRSFHDGGANIALGDGSVRFVSQSVNPATWRSLFSIVGGETTGDF